MYVQQFSKILQSVRTSNERVVLMISIHKLSV